MSQDNYLLRSSSTSDIRPVPQRTKSFKKTFFRYFISKWNKLKVGIRNTKSVNIFKKSILGEKKENSSFCIYNPLGVKLLERLRLQISHLNEHKLDMVLAIESILSVHAELKLKPLNKDLNICSKIRTF